MDKNSDRISVHPVSPADDEKLSTEGRREEADREKGECSINRGVVEDWWVWEVGGIVGSLVCLIGIVFFLKAFDDKPAPPWSNPVRDKNSKNFNIGLNAVLSIMSTCAKLCVLIPIAKGISQLKWVWFANKDRSLEDMDTFDWASKSFAGSMLLLWRTRFRHFAAFAAFAMVISVAWDPFIQNLIKYHTKEVRVLHREDYEKLIGRPTNNYKTAEIPIALTYMSKVREKSTQKHIDVVTSNAISDAVFSMETGWITPDSYCATATCEWPPYIAMGFEAKCENITDLITTSFNDNNDTLNEASLPNGFALYGKYNDTMAIGSPRRKSQDTFTLPDTDFGDISMPPLQIIVGRNGKSLSRVQESSNPFLPFNGFLLNKKSSFYAMECNMFPVLNVWKISTDATKQVVTTDRRSKLGLTDLKISKSFAKVDFSEDGETIELRAPERLDVGLSAEDEVKVINYNRTFRMETYKLSVLYETLHDKLTGSANWDMDNTPFNIFAEDTGYTDISFLTDFFRMVVEDIYTGRFKTLHTANSLCRSGNDNVEDVDQLNFECLLNYIGRGLSNAMNTWAVIAGEKDKDFVSVEGDTLVPITWVSVQWFWIIIPALLWAMGLFILVMTILKTRSAGIKIWRDNPLPILFLDVDKKETQGNEHNMTESEITKRAKALKLSLSVGEHQTQFSKKANTEG